MNGDEDLKLEQGEPESSKDTPSSSTAKRIRKRQNEKSKDDADAPSKAIKLSHIPYGFFEEEILKYFIQFGKVRRVRVARNRRTGNHKGWAFVLFTSSEVAQIAAETMDGYLMYEKRLLCKVLKNSEVPNCLKFGKTLVRPPVKYATSRKHTRIANATKSRSQEAAAEKRLLKLMEKKKNELAKLGLDYSFDVCTHKSEMKKEVKEEEEDVKLDLAVLKKSNAKCGKEKRRKESAMGTLKKKRKLVMKGLK